MGWRYGIGVGIAVKNFSFLASEMAWDISGHIPANVAAKISEHIPGYLLGPGWEYRLLYWRLFWVQAQPKFPSIFRTTPTQLSREQQKNCRQPVSAFREYRRQSLKAMPSYLGGDCY